MTTNYVVLQITILEMLARLKAGERDDRRRRQADDDLGEWVKMTVLL